MLILIFSYYSLISLQVSNIRGNTKLFFVAYFKPHRTVTTRTLARWVKCVLTAAGVDPKIQCSPFFGQELGFGTDL